MSEECPVPLGALSPARPGRSEDYRSARDDDLIEEAGPADDASMGSDLSTLVVPFPDLAPVVFFCLKQTTCPRSWCIRMVLSPWFERITIMVILLNCVTLGMYQPCENIDCASDHCQILQAFDAFIYIFFALEMVVKMVALGIFGRRCYLGDTWNRLDFFIVMAGMVEYSLDLQNINLSAIRTVRVLRPLKAINRVPSLRILVNLLLDTLPMLGNVLLLCFFVFFIFGIIGVQLWAGLLRNRCYLEENFTLSSGMTLPPPYYQPEEDDERPFICSLPSDNGIMSCSDVPARREGGRTCCLDKEDAFYRQALGLSPEPLANGSGEATGLCINWNQYYTRCHTGSSNPHKGAISFDNIVYAWIVIFQVITLEGWVEIMYYVMDAHSFYNFIYFILLIIIGSFFMINLCLVVIATQFSETKQREHQLMQEQRAQCLSSSTLASMAEPGDCYEEIFQLVCHVLRKAKRRSAALYYTLRGKPLPAGWSRSNRHGGGNVNSEHQFRHPRSSHCPHQSRPDHSSQPSANPISLAVPQGPDDCPICAQTEGTRAQGDGFSGKDQEEDAVKEMDKEESRQEENVGVKRRKRTCFRYLRDIWNGMRRKLWGIVESKYFSRGIMIAILINTISMGIEHHNQPDELTNVLEICNIVFTSMFTLEMILKLTAFGFFEYLRNPYNIFDGIIVIISVCEIIGQADGGLSVLRTFRLLRVIKLVRFMPALRRQLVVLMKTMDNVATFCMLLMLFIFIFSILGMHIFGCKFSLKTEAGDTVPDRKNFDSLLWAIVTVFQILTQEDWNVVLYNGMVSTSPCASLYFVALMTFGNYVLFNLLVAILVEGFQAEGDANRSYSDDDRSSCNFDEDDKQKDSLHLSDPKISTLTPNGHLDLPPALIHGETMTFALGSRKNSVISLGRANLEQKAVYPGYHNWGRPLPPHPQALWARRSSWNSLGRCRPCSSSSPSASPAFTPRPFYEYGLADLGGVVGGSLQEIAAPSPWNCLIYYKCPHTWHRHPATCCPLWRSMFTKGRRASLEGWHSAAAVGSVLQPRPRHSGEQAEVLNQQSHLATDVFPQVNARIKNQEDLDDDLDYSLCFRIQKMLEVYRPDWCETREDWSVFLFSPQNKFRQMCQSIIAHKLFDYVVLVFIFSNCITVALERPKILQGSLERVFLTVSNYIFTAIFVGEMTLKVVSMGLYMGEQAYLRSSWNVLDGFLVFVSLVDIVVSMAGGAKILGVLRVLRLLRTLRPLRVISRAPGLKLVVETLITSLKPIGNIVLICCAFFIIFGILGVQLFKGKFFYCLGPDVKNITNKSDCLQANYKWVHHKYNSLDLVLKYCNYFFTSTFVLESILKLIAFGFRRFFKDRWNQLDLAIVLLSVMGITLEEIEISAALPINPTIIRIMRVLRIARVLKLLKMATGMRALLDTVVQALPQVGNLGLLFMLLFFIYAALGVELFGELVCNADYPCEGMSRHATFENFGMAFLTLFQVSTGDNWNGIMKDTLRECPPDHNTEVDYNCNPSLQFISPMYFVSFVLTAQFVLINVVVAVLMKHLDDSNKEAQEEAEMDAEIELELAQGPLLHGRPRLRGCEGGQRRRGRGGHGGEGSFQKREGRRMYSPSQESQWLDSVSLLIQDTLEGEMLMIDNLSGSVFHHYSSPPICKDCKGHLQEIRMAEIEQASLRSEQLSDKSSSPALPDDLSLDEHTAFRLLTQEATERCSSDSHGSADAGGVGGHQTQTVVQTQVQGSHPPCPAISPGVEIKSALQELEKHSHHLPTGGQHNLFLASTDP
eukprot:XP_011602159.1 PREDICTED: LOW QUALITY PROTEIN: voltage-dependent T-type calcium channel subunit alpha-1I [Takifugu rubripes]